jgi:acetyltransferase-like isoleucine patch superfamily enzyme
MFRLITIVFQKFVFTCRFRPYLKSCGKSVAFFFPIRLDGMRYIAVGSNTSIQSNSWIYAEGQEGQISLSIGSGCVLGYNNHITAIQNVIIGNNVLTANNIYISDNYHDYEDIKVPILKQPVKFKGNVEIGDGTWLGENVCVIGAKVGKNCVIGANSVVTKDIPDYSVAVGSPAKIIKKFDLARSEWIKVNF